MKTNPDRPSLRNWGLAAIMVSGFLFWLPRVQAQPLTITHLAGSVGGAGADDGIGSDARFKSPGGVAVDGAGNIYVADSYNYTVRKVSPAGAVSTLAGLAGSWGSADGNGSAARFSYPMGVAVDGFGNVYVADQYNHTIRKVTPPGAVTTLAGLAGVEGSVDGNGSAARFRYPYGLAVDGAGNVYVADQYNHTIRKVTQAGEVTTLAGLAGSWGSANGTGRDARFKYPVGVAVDSAGDVYVADQYNHTIRKVTQAGVATTVAGWAGNPGSADGAGSAARFYYPTGVAVDSASGIYVADQTNHTIRRVTQGGVVTTLAGLAGSQGSTDGAGSAARFSFPTGVATDNSGKVYVANYGTHTIRTVTPAGIVTTLAGRPASWGSADGIGSTAEFLNPAGLAVDGSGAVYVADEDNNTIRKVTQAGDVTTHAGLAQYHGTADGTGSGARFYYPTGVALDSSGNAYVADHGNNTIRKVTPAGDVTTLAGLAGTWGSADGAGNAARFDGPTGVAMDSSGNVYVADQYNHTIRKVTPAGAVTTLAGLAGSAGSADGTGSGARFYYPMSVAVDGSGNLYVADWYNHTIRRVTPAAVVTTLAGLPGNAGSTDGTGSGARFNGPSGVAVDGSGNVYVADSNNQVIRKVTPAGVVTTPAGQAASWGNTDGTGNVARLHSPAGVAVDGLGNIYVADQANHAIRIGRPSLPDVATIDDASGPIAQVRYLDTVPQTATSWTWRQVRVPAPSGSTLSATNVPNPTFTPDVGDRYVFRLTATDVTGVQSLTEVTLDGSCVFPDATIAAPGAVCLGSIGNVASVPDVGPGATYAWTISNGSISSGQGTRTIAFDAGSSAIVALGVTVTVPGCSSPSNKWIPVSGVISVAGVTSLCRDELGGTATITPPSGGSFAYQWGYRTASGGVITDLPGQTGATYVIRGTDFPALDPQLTPLTFWLVCRLNSATCGSVISNEIAVTLTGERPTAVITAPASVCGISSEQIASVPDAGAGATYIWTITNGAITAGLGTPSITFTADTWGAVALAVTVQGGAGCTASGSKSVTFNPVPSATIGAPVAVCAGSTGNLANVANAGAGATYAWAITNGTITSFAGASTIQFTAGASGSVGLEVTVRSGAGCTASGSQNVVVNAPSATITAPATVCARSTGNVASVPDAGTGAWYSWGIGNGTITAGVGTRQITFTADSSEPVGLYVTVRIGACTASATQTVAVNPVPSATIMAPSAVCASSTGNVASVADAGAGATFTWTITNGTITAGAGTRSITFTAGSSGSLTLGVTVQSSAGCTASGSQGVTVNPVPLATITAPAAACANAAGLAASVADAGPGGVYTWTITNGTITGGTGTRGITFTAGAVGPITLGVTVQTAAGCGASGSQDITVNPLPSAAIAAQAAACANASGLSASVPDAGQGATYTWTITNGTITAGTGTRALTFTAGSTGPMTLGVTVQTSAGCSASGSQNITVSPLPSAAITAPTTACANATGLPASVADAGQGAIYTWTITNGTITGGSGTRVIAFTAGATGPITLGITVQTSAGCSATGSQNLTVNALPSATITAPVAACANATGLSASVPDAGQGATYTWTITNGTITTGIGTRAVTFTAGSTGPIALGVTVQTASACNASGSQNVMVNPLPTAAITAPAAACANASGLSASVPDAGPSAVYTWTVTNGSITSGSGTRAITFTVGASGSTSLGVTVTTAAGCVANSSSIVAIGAIPVSTISAPASVCGGAAGVVASVTNAGPGAVYAWTISGGEITSGAGTPTIAFSAAASGSVSLGVTVTTSLGCTSSSPRSVAINPVPSAAVSAPGAVCASSAGNAASVPNAGAGATYSWTVTGGTITSGAGTPSITWSAGTGGSATISVTVSTAAGCTASGSANVAILALPSATITAAASVRKGSKNNSASVPNAGSGATYTWTISNGTITSGAGTASIRYTAGSRGTLTLGVTVRNASGCTQTGSKAVTVTN